MQAMGILWGVIAVLFVFVAIVSIADVVRRHLGAGRTAAWIALIIIFPVVGSLAYWALRKTPQSEVDRSMDADRELRQGSGRRPPRLGA
jgi:hypothetical protein